MLKLRELKAKQAAAKQQSASAAASAPTHENTSINNSSNASPSSPSSSSSGFVLKRQSSKELAETRRSKSKENVFTLKSSGGTRGKSGKVTDGSELRCQKDLAEMAPVKGTRLEFPEPDDIKHFNLYVTPYDGLWEGAEFRFKVEVPQSYPYEPPKVACETPIYHPNIDWEGHVCLNILRADWKPVLDLHAVVFGVVTLFLDPNPDDPLNKEAAEDMVSRRSKFESDVKSSLRGGRVKSHSFPKLL